MFGCIPPSKDSNGGFSLKNILGNLGCFGSEKSTFDFGSLGELNPYSSAFTAAMAVIDLLGEQKSEDGKKADTGFKLSDVLPLAAVALEQVRCGNEPTSGNTAPARTPPFVPIRG